MEDMVWIKTQLPSATPVEVSFPNLVFDKSISIFDKDAWTLSGEWKNNEVSGRDGKKRDQALYAEKPGAELEIAFNGTGISLEGNWYRDGGKADVYVDGNLHRSIDTYYFFANQQHTESIWHVTNLQPGEHKVKLVIKGEKRPESEGTRVYITSATIFKTAPKKNEAFKFSFE